MLPGNATGCYISDVKKLVCPHCDSQVSERASVCVGCGAEVVRGATRAERSTVGLVFVGLAFLIAVVVMRVFEVVRGSSPMPPSDAGGASLYLLAMIGVVVCSYMIGKGVARFFRRSQVRFFRSYRHQ